MFRFYGMHLNQVSLEYICHDHISIETIEHPKKEESTYFALMKYASINITNVIEGECYFLLIFILR